MLLLPELVPRNVQQTTGDLDEELLLIQQEAKLKLEVLSLTRCFPASRVDSEVTEDCDAVCCRRPT